MVKSSAGSLLLARNKMTGWPTVSPWRKTSRTKPGPNSWLNPVTQLVPHDGVDAPAGSRPTALTPPTTVIVAATARTLLLIDIWHVFLRRVSRTPARLPHVAEKRWRRPWDRAGATGLL